MSTLTLVNVRKNYTSVLTMRKTRSRRRIENVELFDDHAEAEQYLKRCKNFYVTMQLEEVVDTQAQVSSMIKSDRVIRQTLLGKLAKQYDTENLIINYQKISEDKQEDLNTYHIDGLYARDLLENLTILPNYQTVKFLSAGRFALFGLSEACLKGENYISVYTEGNRIITIAAHGGHLVFSRVSIVTSLNLEERQMDIVNDINQTISYIHQQFRELRFSFIALSGAMAVDDIVPQHLFLLTNVPVTILHPATLFEGLDPNEYHHHILSLGLLHLPKSLNFLPITVRAQRQYYYGINTLAAAGTAFLLLAGASALSSFLDYYGAVQEYESIRSDLMRLTRQTPLRTEPELRADLKHLEADEMFARYHPLDEMVELRPLIDLNPPSQWEWKLSGTAPRTVATFETGFDTLGGLYEFESAFSRTLAEQNLSQPFTLKNRSRYAELTFDADVEIGEADKAPARSSRRRRR